MFPGFHTGIVNALAARSAKSDVLDDGIEFFGTYVAFVFVAHSLALFLQAVFEHSGSAADEVFVHDVESVDVRDYEAKHFSTDTTLRSKLFKLLGNSRRHT